MKSDLSKKLKNDITLDVVLELKHRLAYKEAHLFS